jgi:hypothetical protein
VSEPNDCPRLIEVHRLWEGETDAPHAGELRRHLTHCSCCRAEVENWDRLSGLLARGDPAAPFVPERQRRMKEQLLADCATSLAAAGDAVPRPSMPRPQTWRSMRPIRLALALVPLGLAGLLLVYTSHSVLRDGPHPTGMDSRLGAAPPRTGHEAPPRPSEVARAPDAPKRAVITKPWHEWQPGSHPRPFSQQLAEGSHERWARQPPLSQTLGEGPGYPRSGWMRARSAPEAGNDDHASPKPLIPPRPRLSPRAAKRPHGAVRFHRLARATTPAPLLRDRQPDPALRPTIAPAPVLPRPIERIIVQVDEPPRPQPVPTQSITHVTVIAAGDPAAPGAQLTVVKSHREEPLP